MQLLCGSINVRERLWASKRQPIDYRRCCTDRLNAPGESRHSRATPGTSANDAVDGAHSAAPECHRVVALKRTTLRGAVHGRGYHDWSGYSEVGVPGSRG